MRQLASFGRRRRRHATALTAMILCACLTGCTHPGPGTDESAPPAAASPNTGTEALDAPRSMALDMPTDLAEDSPLSDDLPAEEGIIARWVEGRSQFGIVFSTSSSCPPVPIAVRAIDQATVSVKFVPFESESSMHACTADAQRTPYLFAAPAGLTANHVTAEISFGLSTDLTMVRIPLEP